MHIAHFTNTYLPDTNGVVRSVTSFRKALAELGNNVFIFAQDAGYEDEEAFVFRYPSLPMPESLDISAAIPISPFIDRLIPSLKLDVLHAHHPMLLGQAAAAQAKALDLPLVFTFHTQYQEYTHYVPFPQESIQAFLKGQVKNWLNNYMRKCQHIVIPSESMRSIIVNEYGLDEGYTVVPTGIDLEPYRVADGASVRAQRGWENDLVMISVGRLAVEKNWETLLRAASLAMKDYPSLRVVILGDGPERSSIEKLAGELGIGDRVQLLGLVPFQTVPAYLKAADFFGFASTSETQGLVTLEALAAGLPVIAVDAPGTRDILEHQRQGLLVENSPQALESAIDLLASQKDRLKELGAAALERAEAFDIMKLAKELLQVYRQAVIDKRENRYAVVRDIEATM